MSPRTKPCPSCGGTLYKDPDGVVEETVLRSSMASPFRRVTRAAVVYGCSTCEHCEEV